MKTCLICGLSSIFLTFGSLDAEEPESFDLVVYGGTSAGIIAGIQAKAMGKSVVVIEPTDREGGLTTGGLGQTDIDATYEGDLMATAGVDYTVGREANDGFVIIDAVRWMPKAE